MKTKIMKSTIIVMILGLSLWSCKKEVIDSSITNSANIEPLKASSLRWFYDNGQNDGIDDFGCRGVGGNCLPDFVVTGAMSPNFSAELEDVLIGGNNNDIIDFFSENQSELNQIISLNIIEDIINGNLTVGYVGTLENNNTLYIKTFDNNKLIYVYPIK